MKKYVVALMAILLITARTYGAVASVVIDNQSGADITVRIEYQGHTAAMHVISAGDKTPFYVEDKCLRGITVYSGRWRTVDDLEYDDKLIIPESWYRCQGWNFIIKKRQDGTMHVSQHKAIPGTKY